MNRPGPAYTRAKARAWLTRPVGRGGVAVLAVIITAAPWLLFFDPIGAFRRAHIPRDPAAIYRLYSDDFAYVAASRTLSRTAANLFVPHNTHIVPAWRVLTWALAAWSGSLAKLPEVLAWASYAILAAVMLLMGRLVGRETGSPILGLGAMAAVGATSVMASPACWYSAGQTLWAGFGILATLWYSQCWRRTRIPAALVLAAVAATLSGWFWTIGHMAGPAAAVYLARDGHRRGGRWAAAIPLGASLAAVLLSLALGGKSLDSTVSFHGRTASQAVQPVEGLWHTAQAIPENLILANLGLKAQTTHAQGATLSALVLGGWFLHRWRHGGFAACNPLECAGLTIVLGSYLVEWTVRGYMPFRYLRTVSLGMIVPWYDVIPQIGAVLFGAGWFAGPRTRPGQPALPRSTSRLTRGGGLMVLGLVTVLLMLNRPRVDWLWRNWVPPLLPVERPMFPLQSMQTMRANALLLERAAWQRRHLRRLDQARDAALRIGIGRAAIRGAFGRLNVPELPEVYDGLGLLDLPEAGRLVEPESVRRALGDYLIMEPMPRPAWLPVGETWPPVDLPHWSESDVDAP